MQLLFPQNPWMRKLPEPLFEAEFDAAKSLGFVCHLFEEEALTAGRIEEALKRLPPATEALLLYRGWILTEERYHLLQQAVLNHGYSLVSTAAQYAEVCYFPNYYPKIREHSPPAVWTDSSDTFKAWSASRKLGNGPFVLKDHIKSAKHQWHDACFVPKGAGREHFEMVAENLKKEQGTSFFRGFVVKQYVPLKLRGQGPWQYPQCEEYRLFFWKGQLLTVSHYHRQTENAVDWTPFLELAKRFTSPFFTMDIALSEAGQWLIVDMGAGEVSSLPPNLTPEVFYRRLAAAVAAT